ncbi:MAG: TetR/AcrR family transcriptional regulator, partial [Raoultibacter sp.]
TLKNEPIIASMFVLMEQAMHNDAAPDSVKKRLAAFDIYEPTAHIIKQGQNDGTIREGDPIALSIAYWCAIVGIAEQLAANPTLPCPDADWIVDIIRKK